MENVWEPDRDCTGSRANSAGTDDEVSFSKFHQGHFSLLKVLEKKVTS
jgi:hypothetical protein